MIRKSILLQHPKEFVNLEDFDMIESVIQGERLDIHPLLVNQVKQEEWKLTSDESLTIFEVSLPKPTPLISLKIEFFYSSDMRDLAESLAWSTESDLWDKDPMKSPEGILYELNEEQTRFDVFYEDVYNWMGRDRGSWIPLIVCSCNGDAFNSTTSVKKLVSDDKRQFAANYAQSQFIFTHQFEKKFVIDRYITMS